MSYQVLARKWRPRNFSEMVGQEHVLKALINALDQNRLHHAYLFTGTRGVGKTTIARILARCLSCEAGVSSVPCGTCSSCLEISEGRSVDLIEVDAASRTKVEDTRELLENVQYAPTSSRFKVYLIDEVHMLSSHSFNALLKTLEEPPQHVKFLLATTDPQKLPATVLSRCLQFNLKNMPPEQIVGHLGKVLREESITFEEPALWLLGRAAAGSMRDALSLADQAIAFGSGSVGEDDVRAMLGSVDLNHVYHLLEAAAANDPGEVLQAIAHMNEHGADFEATLDELLSLIHRVSLAQVVPDAIDNNWGDAERVAELARSLTAEDAQLYYQIALNGKRDITLAPEPRIGLEMIMLRMVAFRPSAVFDETIDPANLLPVTEPQAAQEAGDSIKKSLSAAPAAEPVAHKVLPGVTDTPAVAVSDAPAREPVAAATEPVQRAPNPQPARALQGPTAVDAPAVDKPEVDKPEVDKPGAERVALAELSAQNWWQVLEELGLTGIVNSIARNCVPQRVSGADIALLLDEDNAGLFNETHNGKIAAALTSYFGEPVSVAISTGCPDAETPAMRRNRLIEERQQQAVESIESDPTLQALITHFDGELDRASIAPTDS